MPTALVLFGWVSNYAYSGVGRPLGDSIGERGSRCFLVGVLKAGAVTAVVKEVPWVLATGSIAF